MKNRFVDAFVIFLIVTGIIVTCCDFVKTTPSLNQKEDEKATVISGSAEINGENMQLDNDDTQSKETTTPTETPEETTTPTEAPEETTTPTETPETTTDPTEGKEESESEVIITFESDYICEDGYMPYALYTPSTIDENKKTPLIIWLHGSGEVGTGKQTFFNSGLLKTMDNWKRQGFNAYVICPHLSGNMNTGRWNKEATRDNLKALLDKFIAEHNVDTERIIVVGHSLGGQGALYMAHQLPEYFSRCVVLSGYNPGIKIEEINIPTIGFVGTQSAGEDSGSISYMRNYFMEVFGDECTFFFEASHGAIPNAVFSFDTDDDDKSDLVEWMLGEFEFEN